MKDSQSVKKRLFLNASWLFGGKTASSVFSAIQMVFIARILGLSDYGLLALVVAYVDVLNQLFDFRVWETATKYIGTFWAKGEGDKASSMIKLSYIIDISSGILAFVIAILTAKIASVYFIHSPQAHYLIFIYAFSLFIDTANSTSYAILRVFDKFRQIAFISSLQSFSRLVLVLVVLYLGMGIKGVLLAYIASTFLGFAIRLRAVAMALKEKQLQGWWKSDLNLIRDQWKGIAWFLGNTSLAATIKMAGDNYMGILALGYFSGKEAAAYYKIAQTSAKLMTRITDPLYEAIYPELVKILSGSALKDFKRLLKYTTKNLMKFVVPVAAVIFIFAGTIISLVFGKEYVPAENALRIVTVAVIISKAAFWTSPALLAIGRPGLRTLVGMFSTVIYLASLFVLVPKFSYVGAAYAYLIYTIVRTSVSISATRMSINEKKRLLTLEVQEPLDREI